MAAAAPDTEPVDAAARGGRDVLAGDWARPRSPTGPGLTTSYLRKLARDVDLPCPCGVAI